MSKIDEANFGDQGVLFRLTPVTGKDVSLIIKDGDVSSDGGLLLVRECEHRTDITAAIARCVGSDRHQL